MVASSESIPCLKKKQAKFFCYNYVKLPPNLIIFWHKDGKQSEIV